MLIKTGVSQYKDITEYTTTRAVLPPMNRPLVSYGYDEDSFFTDLLSINPQFKVNFHYFNNEKSVFSPVSEVLPKIIYNTITDSTQLSFGGQDGIPNVVDVRVDIPDNYPPIYGATLLVRKSSGHNWFILKEFTKSEVDVQTLQYTYNGKEQLLPIDQTKVNKLYSAVPDKVNDMVIFDNRIFDVGITEGQDGIDTFNTSLEVVEIGDTTTGLSIVEQAYTTGGYGIFGIFTSNGWTYPIPNLQTILSINKFNPSQFSPIYFSYFNVFVDNKYASDIFNGLWVIDDVSKYNSLVLKFTLRIRIDATDDSNLDIKIPFNFRYNYETFNYTNFKTLFNNELTDIENKIHVANGGYNNHNFKVSVISNTDYSLNGETLSVFLQIIEKNTHWGDDNNHGVIEICIDSPPDNNLSLNEGYLKDSAGDSYGRIFQKWYFDNVDFCKIANYWYSDNPLECYGVKTIATDDVSEYNVWKSGTKLNFAIRYFDEFGKYGYDQKGTGMSCIIPSNFSKLVSNKRKVSGIKYNIEHTPPSFAKYYTLVVANQNLLYNSYYVPYKNYDTKILYDDYVLYKDDDGDDVIKIKIYSTWVGNDFMGTTNPIWDFKKGDRIRIKMIKYDGGKEFILGYTHYGNHVNPIPFNHYDLEIASLQLEELTSGTDTKTEYILKLNNNSNDASHSLVVTDIQTYIGITNIEGFVFEIYRPIIDDENQRYFEFEDRHPIYGKFHGGGWTANGETKYSPQTSTTPAYGILKGGNTWIRNIACSKHYSAEVDGTIIVKTATKDFFGESLRISEHIGAIDTSFDKVGLAESEYSKGKDEFTMIRHSNKLIKNLNINGLSDVDLTSYTLLDDSFGRCNAIESLGNSIIVFQDRKVTSFYVGREELTNADGNTQLIRSHEVLSTPQKRIEDYGCVFKTSITKVDRNIFFYDIFNKTMCMYASNGIFDIAKGEQIQSPEYKYKMGKYFKDKSEALISSGFSNINVISTYSEMDKMLFVTFLDKNNVKNNETIGFHQPSNRWISFYSFIPEFYVKYAETYGSITNGQLYIHGIGDTIYGEPINSEVDFIVNAEPNVIKLFDWIRLHSNKALDTEFDILKSTISKNGMFSKLVAGNYSMYENKFECETLNNMKTTSEEPSLEELYTGDRLRGYAIKVSLKGADIELFGVDIGLTYS